MTAAELEYAITCAVARLDDDESDEAAAEVARLVDLAEDKAAALVHVVRRADAEAQLCRTRAAKMTARAHQASAREQWAREALGHLVAAMGGRVRGTDFSASIQPSSRVDVLDLSAVPAGLTRTTVEPDKARILAQLRAGELVAGCALVTGRVVVIR